jgi:hypothetical protein
VGHDVEGISSSGSSKHTIKINSSR